MNYQQTIYLKSVFELRDLPLDVGMEVAFIGCSNAGKSTAMNALLNQKLARTSKTPGRTQMINVFQVNETYRLIDLPGYGFAKVPEAMKKKWQASINNYLTQRVCLRALILVMDSRHPMKALDDAMLVWCAQRGLAVHVLLTKADKLGRGAAKAVLLGVSAALKKYPTASVQLFSGRTRAGRDEFVDYLDKLVQQG